ncbi:hypothetical protein G9A89_005178 [Geosiphon pyriformis]|nr:hypothetical protein G9A89_005178 [Geosiphon pyriformis]
MEEKLELLSNFSTCDIADALLEIGHPHGGFLPDIVMFAPEFHAGPSRCVGPAFTVKVVHISEPVPKLEKHFADAAPEGSVVVVSAPSNSVNAVWGGLMNTRVRTKGVKGVVVDGRVRDLEELHKDGLPVFARGLSILSARKYTHPAAINLPIIINGDYDPAIVVNPEDLIVADLNGVVCIPKEYLDHVLDLSKKQVNIDTKIKQDLGKGISIAEAFKRHRN